MGDNRKSVIEALLLASERPLGLEKIRDVLDNLPAKDTLDLIEELRKEYNDGSRGIRVVEIAGGFQMITAPEFAPFLKKLFKGRNTERLSKPALETLAIIAYKQPLTRSEIELLRNVNVDGVMKSLLDKSLIRISGRKKAAGNPYVYGTTRQFLEHFGLKSLQDLPKIEDFSSLAEKTELIEEFPEGEKQAEGENGPENITQ
ncbi:MAG: SMC-Scp complex subunit ScpB [Candidatus Omnitrophica bacterium]|jgi:segregation and condensation protein B|nr:SMC-Scp complex subunit ScpB [Candidatus Omnitrophota bacterium]MDD3987485.1 SMC-Scp complex subunit ScpB [Candidatus Omnitrophota bacterium]